MSDTIQASIRQQSIVTQINQPTIQTSFTAAPATSGGSGVSDHGALTGLSDNDHPQYLLITARLAEFSTAQAKADARAALELQYIDGGTF